MAVLEREVLHWMTVVALKDVYLPSQGREPRNSRTDPYTEPFMTAHALSNLLSQ